jgi:HTH-type transcriptional regulator/antitoxin HigA
MSAAIKHAINHWGHILPYTHIPRTESEYEKLLHFVDELMEISRQQKSKNDDRVTSLLKMCAKNIEAYETRHFLTKPVSPAEMLKFLMEEHSLEQSDLPEIGSQSLVSKILNGERQLTISHVKYLSNRFGVSPSVFIEAGKDHSEI